MIKLIPQRFRTASVIAVCTAASAIVLMPTSAQARVFVGLGFGLPYYYGPAYIPPPIYYPPPVYYPPPPPVYYTPIPQQPAYTPGPTAQQGTGGQSCYAGPYVCPMDRPIASGSPCFCLGNAGQRVSGRAN